MPLDPAVLLEQLIRLDEDGGAQDAFTAAQRWALAWKLYAQGMIYLAPGAAELMASSFQTALLPGVVPPYTTPRDPTIFYNALEAAMRSGWASAILVPPVISLSPAPASFAFPAIAETVVFGLGSQEKFPPRSALVRVIHTWTLTHLTVTATPPYTIGPVL